MVNGLSEPGQVSLLPEPQFPYLKQRWENVTSLNISGPLAFSSTFRNKFFLPALPLPSCAAGCLCHPSPSSFLEDLSVSSVDTCPPLGHSLQCLGHAKCPRSYLLLETPQACSHLSPSPASLESLSFWPSPPFLPPTTLSLLARCRRLLPCAWTQSAQRAVGLFLTSATLLGPNYPHFGESLENRMKAVNPPFRKRHRILHQIQGIRGLIKGHIMILLLITS